MPNWTSNRIEAPAEVLKKYISKDENGKDRFDFNLVIPRPEIYNDPDLVSGGYEHVAIEWYRSDRGLKPHDEDFSNIENLYGDLEKLYVTGKKYVEVYNKYGYYDWYSWSVENWGKPVKNEYTYLASRWATPVIILDGEEIDCYQPKGYHGWDADTKWPESALKILDSKEE